MPRKALDEQAKTQHAVRQPRQVAFQPAGACRQRATRSSRREAGEGDSKAQRSRRRSSLFEEDFF